jgi:hypothetical protein
MNLLLLSGVALANNFVLGQFYLVLLFLTVAGYYLIEQRIGYASGVIWGIGAAIKYYPIIFLPEYVQKRNWKLLLGFIFSFLVVNIIGVYIIGPEVYKNYFNSVLLSHLNGELSNQSSFAYQFQSWNSLLRILFVYDPVENPVPIIDWQFGFTITRVIIYSGMIIITVITFLKTKRHSLGTPLHISLLGVIILLLSPASASYHYLLLAFPTILLLKMSRENNQLIYGSVFILLYALIGFLPIIIPRLFQNFESNLILSFHRLWLVTVYYLLLIYYIWFGMRRRVERN